MEQNSTQTILSTEAVVAAFLSNNDTMINAMIARIFSDYAINGTILFARKTGRDSQHVSDALADAILAFKEKIQTGNFREGNWRAYLRRIFWNRYSDLFGQYTPGLARKYAEGKFSNKAANELIDLEMLHNQKEQQSMFTPDEDYWIHPFSAETLQYDQRVAYELVFKIFDKIETCQRDKCSSICRARVEEDIDYELLLNHLENKKVNWDDHVYDDPNSDANLKKRNQRLRDRVRECWRRLRNFINDRPELADSLFDSLS